jgi:hypothetical protein
MEKSAQNRRKIGALGARQMKARRAACAVFRWETSVSHLIKMAHKLAHPAFRAFFAGFRIGAQIGANRRTQP